MSISPGQGKNGKDTSQNREVDRVLARKDLPVFPPLKTKEEKDFVILKNRIY